MKQCFPHPTPDNHQGERMLPQIRPFRSGRESCPPSICATVPPKTAKLSKFDAAAHSALAKVSRSVKGDVFDTIADHLLAFDGEGLGPLVSQACARWLAKAEATLARGEAVNDATAVATLVALDQVLALAVKQNPSLDAVAWRLRKHLHSIVFISPSECAERPTRLVVGAYKTLLSEEEALDDFRDRRTLLGACKQLLDENRSQQRQLSLFQHVHTRHRSAVMMLCRGMRLTTLTKAFYAWRGQVACDREIRRREAEWSAEVEKLRAAQQKLLGEFVRTEKALHQSEMKLEYSDHAQKQLSTIDHAHERKVATLNTEIRNLKQQLSRAERQLSDVESAKAAQVESIEQKWRTAMMETRAIADNPYENSLRSLFDPTTFTSYTELLPWAKQMVALRGGRWGTYSDKLPGSPLAYLVILHVMSPGHLPSTALSRAVAGSAASHLDALAHYAAAIKLRFDGDVKRVAESSRDQDKLLFALFERFCGQCAGCRLKPPDFVDDVNYWALELNIQPPAAEASSESWEECATLRAHELEANAAWLEACTSMTKSCAMYNVLREDVS